MITIAPNRAIETKAPSNISERQLLLARLADYVGNSGSVVLPGGERVKGGQLRLWALGKTDGSPEMAALAKLPLADVLFFCDDVLRAAGNAKPATRHLALPDTLATSGSYGSSSSAIEVKDAPLAPPPKATPTLPPPVLVPAPAAAPPKPLTEADAIAQVKKDPSTYGDLPEDLKANPKVAKAAFAKDWRVFKHAPAAICSDADVRKVVTDAIMKRMPADLQDKRADIDALLGESHCPRTLPSELMRPEVGAVLMEVFDKSAWGNLPRALLQNPETWVCYADQEPGRGKRWPILGELQKMSAEERAKLGDDLKKANISHVVRFASVASLRQAIADRDPKPGDTRPVSLVVFPQADHNWAFVRPQMFEQMQKQGYRMIYVEAGSDTEFVDAVDKSWGGKKPEVLLIGGHGWQYGTELGSEGGEASSLDHSDMKQLSKLKGKLADDAKVVLFSCSTGAQAAKDANVANLMAQTFPNTTVFAPMKPASRLDFRYEGGHLVDATFDVPRYTPGS